MVEDLTTTGMSVKKTVECIRKSGGKVVGVCVMVNRDPINVNSKTIGVPFSSLGVFRAEAYEAHKCPLCKNNIPINEEIGHGKNYNLQKFHRVGGKKSVEKKYDFSGETR